MKSPQPVNLATLYSGQSRHAIDGSNRIMLPPEWRVDGAPERFFVVAAAEGTHLLVCPPAVWETFIAELRAGTADKALIPELDRELNRRARMVSLDRFGRLALPREFTAALGLTSQGELLGRFSKFEIWPAEQPAKPSAARATAEAMVSEKLKGL